MENPGQLSVELNTPISALTGVASVTPGYVSHVPAAGGSQSNDGKLDITEQGRFRPFGSWARAINRIGQAIGLIGALVAALLWPEAASAAGSCTPQQVQDFYASCAAQGAAYKALEDNCVAVSGSHAICGFYPWPSKIEPKDSVLACSVMWIRSPNGNESPDPWHIIPVGAITCGCAPEEVWSDEKQRCLPTPVPDGPPSPPPPSCPADSNPNGPKPIYPLSGSERFDLSLGVSIGGRALTATYDTVRRSPVKDRQVDKNLADNEKGHFGPLWTTNFHKRLLLGTARTRGASDARERAVGGIHWKWQWHLYT